MVSRGEVWWYEEPSEKRRPLLILTRDEAIPLLRQVLAVPATGRSRGIPTEVGLDQADGMPTTCVLSIDNTRLAHTALFTGFITRLGPERMEQVCQALRNAIRC